MQEYIQGADTKKINPVSDRQPQKETIGETAKAQKPKNLAQKQLSQMSKKITMPPIKILLVEDNPADADLLQEILEEAIGVEWELVPVELRREAIFMLTNQHFNAVLLDLSLPDSHGLETLIRLREIAPDTPMVVMTGLDDEAIALEAVRLGAQDYIVKGRITSQLLVRSLRYAIERSQTLHLLTESERRFRAIFDQTFQLMALLTPEGIVVEINQTALDFMGDNLENSVGSYLWENRGWNVSSATQTQLKNAIYAAAQGKFIRYEIQLNRVDTKLVTIDFSLKPVYNESEKIVLLIAEGRDISDRKQAEAEIIKSLEKERELSELRARFVSMVSHEFRTPLSTIVLSTGLLETYSAKWSNEKKATHFQRIQTAVNRMTSLLEDILVIGKAEAGKLEFNPVTIDLKNLCYQIVEDAKLASDHNNCQINLVCQGNCTQAKMDEKLLRQILGNLVSNAIKYSNNGGIVNVELICPTEESNCEINKPVSREKPPNHQAIFRIQDQGIGIPADDLEHIFDTFHRATNVGTISGTGLGLAIVKRAVDLHSGQISCHSTVGVGTTFTVILPLGACN